jgi:hypothetical protein
MGHAKISTTINTYTHAIKSKDALVADLMDEIINLDSIPRPNIKEKTASDTVVPQ